MVVGIGASAGGLTALQRFFADVPRETGIAFVVVVHLSPDHESHLASVLQPHALLRVEQVTESVALEADRIYLIPPGANLDAIDTHLRLSKLEVSRKERAPVDHFFRTLAEAHDGHAVGIILSGTGSDGALGVKAIKEKGGLAIAQDPNDAEYDGMPQSAIATGAVDLVLPLAEIPPAVLRYAHTKPQITATDDEEEVAEDAQALLHKLFGQIRARTGRDFTRYKRSTLLRRIARRMQLQQIEELPAYVEQLRSSPDEARALADDFLITVTNFFRDPLVYEKLETDVLPAIFARKTGDDRDVRVWSVGCATGEEAYSLAMLCLEEAARHDPAPRIQVFASDLHEHSLERARHAFYPGDIQVDVSAERLRRFFLKEEGGYRVRKEVRDVVVFAPHNLLADPPFSRLDLIACRNLLIYLQRNAQQEVDELFHYALRPHGFLVVGNSESLVRPELFLAEDKKACIYRKRDVPTPEPRLQGVPTWRGLARDRRPLPEADQRRVSYGDLHVRILERYGPPTLLVGPDDRVVNLSGEAGRYLQHPSGELTASAFKLVREELRLELRACLGEARRSGAEVRTRPIRVQLQGSARPVVLRARPSTVPQELGFVLVLFEEWDAEREAGSPAEAQAIAHTLRERPEHELEAELELMRHQLQAIVEEYETSQEEMRASNEELQSANEEFRSTLEELETSKEELHSMNEELQTANQENRHKVDELAQLSGDLQNLLTATDIATLFLDRELRIMRFTPKVRDLFNVRATDRGRPLSDLTHRLAHADLHADAAAVLARLVPIERDVTDETGRCYFMRLLPYRSTVDRIDGVVLTFVDITAMKEVEGALRQSEERVTEELAAMLRLHELVSRLLVCADLATALAEVLDSTLALTHAHMGNVQLLGADGVLRIAIQRGLSEAFLAHFGQVQAGGGAACGRALEGKRRVIIHDVMTDAAYVAHREVAAAAGYRGVQSTPLISREGEALGVLSTHFAKPYHPSERDLRILDLYARQAAEFIERVRSIDVLNEKTRLLVEEDQRKGFFLAALGHELRNPLAALDAAMRVIEQGIRSSADLQPLMATQVEQLKRLVNDLLEISRITRGTIALRKTRTDLVALIRRVAASVEAGPRTKQQQLVLPTESVHAHVDEVRLEQVLANLLTNASKYSPEGARIEVSAWRERQDVLIAVRDEGRGLRSEDLRRIFEPFEQVDSRGGGLGIGLALAKRLVELHDGSIEAASEGSGRGSVFTLRLPVGEADSAVVAPDAGRIPEALPRGTRVLVVDDQRDNADTLGMLLNAQGADVRCAYTGADAIEQARSWRPQVALVDLGLPDMTGYAVAEQIRAAQGEGVLLLAVTGFGDPAADVRAKRAGFAERLVKPIDHQRLDALIARHLAQGRS